MRVNVPYYWTLRTWIGTRPMLFETAFRAVNRGSGRMVGRDTEIVIEGYPRSANSFSVFALRRAEGRRRIAIATHTHAPSQFMRAAEYGTPAVLLIRAPEDAARALIEKVPHFTLADALSAYALYYRALLPYRDAFVIGVFDRVTRDFGGLVARLNRRFGTGYRVIDRSEHETIARAYLASERFAGARGRRPGYLRRGDRPRPVTEAALAAQAARLARCREIYETYVAFAAAEEEEDARGGAATSSASIRGPASSPAGSARTT